MTLPHLPLSVFSVPLSFHISTCPKVGSSISGWSTKVVPILMFIIKQAIIFDIGTSTCIKNQAANVKCWDMDSMPWLRRITSSTTVNCSGIVKWILVDNNIKLCSITMHVFYVPYMLVGIFIQQNTSGNRKLKVSLSVQKGLLLCSMMTN